MTVVPASGIIGAMSSPVPLPSDEQIEAYDRGRQAWQTGRPSTDVPYDAESDLWRLWIRGWVQARREERYGPRV